MRLQDIRVGDELKLRPERADAYGISRGATMTVVKITSIGRKWWVVALGRNGHEYYRASDFSGRTA